MKKMVLGIVIIFLSNYHLLAMEKEEKGKEEQDANAQEEPSNFFSMSGKIIPYDIVKRIPLIYRLYQDRHYEVTLPDQYSMEAFTKLITFITENKALFPETGDQGGVQEELKKSSASFETFAAQFEKFAAQKGLLEYIDILMLINYLDIDKAIFKEFMDYTLYVQMPEEISPIEKQKIFTCNSMCKNVSLKELGQLFKEKGYKNQLHFSSQHQLDGSDWILDSSAEDDELCVIEKNVGLFTLRLFQKTDRGWEEQKSQLTIVGYVPVAMRMVRFTDKGCLHKEAAILCNGTSESRPVFMWINLLTMTERGKVDGNPNPHVTDNQFDAVEAILAWDSNSLVKNRYIKLGENIFKVVLDFTDKVLKVVPFELSTDVLGFDVSKNREKLILYKSTGCVLGTLEKGDSEVSFSVDTSSTNRKFVLQTKNERPESVETVDGKEFLFIGKPGFFTSKRALKYFDFDEYSSRGRDLPINLYPVCMLSDKGIAGIYNKKLIFLDTTTSFYNIVMTAIEKRKLSNTNKEDIKKEEDRWWKQIDSEIKDKTAPTLWQQAQKYAVPTAVLTVGAFALYKGLQWWQASQRNKVIGVSR